MPIGTPTLLAAADADTANTTSYAQTVSVAPPANSLLIAAILATRATGAVDTPTLAGLSLTWTRVTAAEATYDTGAGTRQRISVFVANAGGSPSTGTLTFTYPTNANTGATIISYYVTGADLSVSALAAIRQAKSNTVTAGTSVTATFDSTPLSTGALIAFMALQNNPALTHRTSWTEDVETGYPTPTTAQQSQSYVGSDTAASASWTGNNNGLLTAIEILVASGGGGTSILRQMMQHHA